MAEPSNTIFNKKALDKIYNPDDLNRSLRVVGSGFWAALCACAVFIAGFFIWAVFGTITESLSVKGADIEGQICCFLTEEESADVSVGDSVNVEGVQMTVSSKSDFPLSAIEAKGILRIDYLVDKLVDDEWKYFILLEGDTSSFEDNSLVDVTVITKSVSPISLILGGDD